MKIAIINGPNLALLGTREPETYGTLTLNDINKEIKKAADIIGVEVGFFQSDIEGEIVKKIADLRESSDALIINPAAYTHTSVAIRDALAAYGKPCVEVHLSNVYKREEFRHVSLTAANATGVITGFGYKGYIMALQYLADKK
ncbi:MAG: type II 3-dehydroquinate dehydratase [Elusimicrobia bacterium]|nr:type II 3-dehydroquinate dehydratase [Elusimicrobiota bacterium]